MGGYELYGDLTLYSQNATGHVYCEKKTAGKSAYTVYSYKNTSGKACIKTAGSEALTYNNKTDLTATTPYPSSSDFYNYYGAMTIARVKYPDATYYSWTSEGTDNELRMGCYK